MKLIQSICRAVSIVALVVIGATACERAYAVAPLRIDFGMDTGRSDTATLGWHEWQVPNGAEATKELWRRSSEVALYGAGEVQSRANGTRQV